MGTKILVVDDEKKILEVLKAYLEVQGYQVFTAENGRQALEVFYEVEPKWALI